MCEKESLNSSCKNTCKYTFYNCIHGYHIYREYWNTAPGEMLTCTRERGKRNDMFAVAVKNIVGCSYLAASSLDFEVN